MPRAFLDNNVYLLGAGFSVPAGLPTLRHFLDRMRDSVDWLDQRGWEKERGAVERVLNFRLAAAAAAYRVPLDVENIEELFSLAAASEAALARDVVRAIAATIAFCEATSDAPETGVVVATRDGVPAGAGWKLERDGNRPGEKVWRMPTVHAMVGGICGLFSSKLEPGQNTVITFNYDMVVERALRELGIGVEYALGPGDAASNAAPPASQTAHFVKVLKLHGSVNWTSSLGGERVATHVDYSAARRLDRQVLLIPPTWNKAFPRQMARVWEASVAAIREATRVVVIGFSVPSTDTHFRYLLAAGLRENISLRSICFVKPEIEEMRRRIESLLRPELLDLGVVRLVDSRAEDFLRFRDGLVTMGRGVDGVRFMT